MNLNIVLPSVASDFDWNDVIYTTQKITGVRGFKEIRVPKSG